MDRKYLAVSYTGYKVSSTTIYWIESIQNNHIQDRKNPALPCTG